MYDRVYLSEFIVFSIGREQIILSKSDYHHCLIFRFSQSNSGLLSFSHFKSSIPSVFIPNPPVMPAKKSASRPGANHLRNVQRANYIEMWHRDTATEEWVRLGDAYEAELGRTFFPWKSNLRRFELFTQATKLTQITEDWANAWPTEGHRREDRCLCEVILSTSSGANILFNEQLITSPNGSQSVTVIELQLTLTQAPQISHKCCLADTGPDALPLDDPMRESRLDQLNARAADTPLSKWSSRPEAATGQVKLKIKRQDRSTPSHPQFQWPAVLHLLSGVEWQTTYPQKRNQEVLRYRLNELATEPLYRDVLQNVGDMYRLTP